MVDNTSLEGILCGHDKLVGSGGLNVQKMGQTVPVDVACSCVVASARSISCREFDDYGRGG